MDDDVLSKFKCVLIIIENSTATVMRKSNNYNLYKCMICLFAQYNKYLSTLFITYFYIYLFLPINEIFFHCPNHTCQEVNFSINFIQVDYTILLSSETTNGITDPSFKKMRDFKCNLFVFFFVSKEINLSEFINSKKSCFFHYVST